MKVIDHTHRVAICHVEDTLIIPIKLVLSAAKLLCSSADLGIYWHSSHERLAQLLGDVYKDIIIFILLLPSFIIGLDPSIVPFLRLLLNLTLRILHIY